LAGKIHNYIYFTFFQENTWCECETTQNVLCSRKNI
jgi:hypothetical protein